LLESSGLQSPKKRNREVYGNPELNVWIDSVKYTVGFVGVTGNLSTKTKPDNQGSCSENSLTPISKYLGRFQVTGAGTVPPCRVERSLCS
jgi:hypothetical protein